MDEVSHILWAILFFGRNKWKWLIAGIVANDFLYALAYVLSYPPLHVIGQYLQSIFITSTLLAISLFFHFKLKKHVNLSYFLYGYVSNTVLDLLGHTCDGSRYFFPFSYEIYKIGLFCWREQVFTSWVLAGVVYSFLILTYQWDFKKSIITFFKLKFYKKKKA